MSSPRASSSLELEKIVNKDAVLISNIEARTIVPSKVDKHLHIRT